jgi:hypothetical protein
MHSVLWFIQISPENSRGKLSTGFSLPFIQNPDKSSHQTGFQLPYKRLDVGRMA